MGACNPPYEKNATFEKRKKVANKKNVRKDDVSIEKIKENLISQLKKRKADEEVYRDLVDDYVAMWNIKNQLIDDINTRGVQVKTFNSNGQEVYKKTIASSSFQNIIRRCLSY